MSAKNKTFGIYPEGFILKSR